MTLPSIFRNLHPHTHRYFPGAISQTPAPEFVSIIAVTLVSLILAMPLVSAALCGMAWWTIRKGKSSGRGWAIAASLIIALPGVPVLFSAHYISRHLLIVGLSFVVVGIAGLVAFGPRNAMTQGPVVAAKPSRISGDGTSGLVDGIAWIAGIVGYFAGAHWWNGWAIAHNLPIDHGYLLWIYLLAAILISSTLHEFAHAAVGVALGMKLRMFLVGPFQWQIRDGRWMFQFQPAKFLSSLGGAIGIVPSNPQQSRWKDICVIAAGPLASLCTGVLALGAALSAKDQSYEQVWQLFSLVSTISLIAFLMNLIPLRPEVIYSDGARIYQLIRGGPLTDLYRVFSFASSTLVTPLRPRDYDIEAIQRASHSFTQGLQALMLRLVSSEYYLDCGKFTQSSEALAEAESIYQKSALNITVELHTIFIFGNAFLRHDAANARLWWERMKAKKPTHFGVDYWLVRCALLWIEGRKEEAYDAWNKGNHLAQGLPKAGSYEFDRYCYSLLRQALDGAASADCCIANKKETTSPCAA